MAKALKRAEMEPSKTRPRLSTGAPEGSPSGNAAPMQKSAAATARRPSARGARYRPLSDPDMAAIHDAALDVLETVGFADAIPTCLDTLTGAGCTLGADGRVRFPRALVEDTIRVAARAITLHGQAPAHDLRLDGGKVHFGTAGAAVHLVDAETRDYRESTARDIYDAARIVERMDNIHFFQRPMVARDVSDPFDLDLNTLYACIAGTSKHVGTSFTVAESVKPALDMLHLVAGGEAAFRARPFVSNSNRFVVSPLKFAEDACGVLEACVRGGMPILLLSVGQAGSTAPASLAGAVVQTMAEVLAGLVYVNAIRPGHPAILGAWPFASDPGTGMMAGGGPEQALLSAACAQMAQFYDLPGGSAAGMTDAKMPDAQSGFEKGITNVMAALAGSDLVYEAAGMHASLLGFCLESLIIDNDMLGHCQHAARGIDVSPESLGAEAIADVCLKAPGHYLGRPETRRLMDEEYYAPAFSDRHSASAWLEGGRDDIVARAIREKKRILAAGAPVHMGKAIDERIRARFPNIVIGREPD